MSIDNVRNYLKQFNVEDKIIELKDDISTVYLAAVALGITEGEIAKSLAFRLKNKCIIVVMKGNNKIDNNKYKNKFKEKARMLSHDEVYEFTGHKVGGVCPFAVKEGVEVYLDISLKEYDHVYPACGSSNSCIKLSIEEMEKYSKYIDWVDISK